MAEALPPKARANEATAAVRISARTIEMAKWIARLTSSNSTIGEVIDAAAAKTIEEQFEKIRPRVEEIKRLETAGSPHPIPAGGTP